MATATEKALMDQLAERMSRNPFFGDKRVENDLRVQGVCVIATFLTEIPRTISTILSLLTFITFSFLPKSIQHVFVHPVSIMCKIIPQN